MLMEKNKGNFLFYFCGEPVYEGDETHEGLKTLKKLKNRIESSKRMTRMHEDGTLKCGIGNKNLVAIKMDAHYFTKQNGATLEDKRGCYDLLKCDKCGLIGKQYGIEDYVLCDGKHINNCS